MKLSRWSVGLKFKRNGISEFLQYIVPYSMHLNVWTMLLNAPTYIKVLFCAL